MTFWRMIRSIIATELMMLAIRAAPPEEKISARLAFMDHLFRCLNPDQASPPPAIYSDGSTSRPKPTPPTRL